MTDRQEIRTQWHFKAPTVNRSPIETTAVKPVGHAGEQLHSPADLSQSGLIERQVWLRAPLNLPASSQCGHLIRSPAALCYLQSYGPHGGNAEDAEQLRSLRNSKTFAMVM